jgi:hypothetical protein
MTYLADYAKISLLSDEKIITLASIFKKQLTCWPKKTIWGAGAIAQWYRIYLASASPWAASSAPHGKKKTYFVITLYSKYLYGMIRR